MFENFLRVLSKGKPEHVQLLKLHEDMDYADLCIAELPDNVEGVNLEWLKTIDWYRQGGYKEVRAAAYPSLEEQEDMKFHDVENDTATWVASIKAVKEAWPKP